MIGKKRYLMLGITLLQCYNSYAQHLNLPLNYNLNQQIEQQGLQNDSTYYIHYSVKPFVQTFIPSSVYNYVYNDTGKYYYAVTEKLYQKNLLSVEEKNYTLVADPLFDISYGKSTVEDSTFKISSNVRGVRVAGTITKYFSFETRAYETQKFYPAYLDSISNQEVSFGMGRAKPFKDRGYDAAMSTGYISYTPVKWLNIQYGHGKQFIGNGYRSLFISDNTSPTLYLATTLHLFQGRIMYQNTNRWMQALERIPVTNSAEPLFKRKGGGFRYLSLSVNKQLQIGLFEGVIYRNYKDKKEPLSYEFYIPVIGLSTVINGMNGTNNSLLGLNVNYIIKQQYAIYAQFLYDDNDKKGVQIGGKWFNVAGQKNSWLQIEYNNVDSYTYTRGTLGILESYSHDNQPLAHPLGAGFSEFLLMMHFEKERFFIEPRTMLYTKHYNSLSGQGSNLVVPNDLPETGQYTSQVTFSGIEAGYLFNRKTNMQLFGAYYYRNETITDKTLLNLQTNKFESFWRIGIRTNLDNYYHDL